MSHNSEDGLIAMIERLWRAFMAVFWIAVMVLVPIMGMRGLYVACRKRRAAKEKHERWYWSNEILFNSCVIYGILVIYYHLFQDILFLPFGLQAQAHFTAYFDTIMGLPAAVWYGAMGEGAAFGDDPLALLTPTFFGVFLVFLCSFAVSALKVFGHVDEVGDWLAPDRVNRERLAQFDREEAPKRALSKQLHELEIRNPKNHPAWNELSNEQQERLTAKWEAERAEIWKKIDECPRASYFNQPR